LQPKPPPPHHWHYCFSLPVAVDPHPYRTEGARRADEMMEADAARRLPEMAGARMASAPAAGSSARKRARG
jgi:hypothetical protein